MVLPPMVLMEANIDISENETVVLKWAKSWENLFLAYTNIPHSMISAFVVHCLDIMTHLSCYIWNFKTLATVAEQTSSSLTWSQTPKTGFLII